MTINILAIVVILFFVIKMMNGYKCGMVKSILSFLSLIVLCALVALIGNGLHSYFQGEVIGVIVAFLLLAVLGIIHHIFSVVVFPAKLISKLPIVSWLDKMLGVVVGAIEALLIVWTMYVLIMLFNMGMVGEQILAWTEESEMLTWLYQNNYLAVLVEKFLSAH